MATPEKKQVMDVKKPGRAAANPTARPVIIGHGAMIKDPMVKDKGSEPATDVPDTEDGLAATPPPSKAELRVEVPQKEDEVKSSPSVDATKTPDKTVVSPVGTPTESSSGPVQDNSDKTPTEDTPAVADDSVIVDAVADQAKLGGEDKKKAEEEAARQEAINKLVQDKTYFVQVGQVQRRRNNRLAVIALAAVVIIAVGGYLAIDARVIDLGVSLPVHVFKQKTAASTNTLPAQQAATPVSTTLTYKSTDLGFQFTYPRSWGAVTVDKQPSPGKGSTAVIGFSKQPKLRAGLVTTDYTAQAANGGCYTTLGLLPGSTIGSIAASIKEGDVATNTTTRKATNHILLTTGSSFAYEHFEAGTASTTTCLGASLDGFISFAATAPYTGVQFFWGDSTITSMPVTEFATYKTSPNAYLADADRQAFIAVIKSVTVLQTK